MQCCSAGRQLGRLYQLPNSCAACLRSSVPAWLQEATGYRLEVATVRRLEYENDTFAFGDKLISKWYPGAAKVGSVVVVVMAAEGPAAEGVG